MFFFLDLESAENLSDSDTEISSNPDIGPPSSLSQKLKDTKDPSGKIKIALGNSKSKI